MAASLFGSHSDRIHMALWLTVVTITIVSELIAVVVVVLGIILYSLNPYIRFLLISVYDFAGAFDCPSIDYF